MPSSTPETLTAAQRAARLNLQKSPTTPGQASDHAHTDTPMSATTTSKQQQKVMEQQRKSLPPIGGARPSATAKLDPKQDADESFAILPIDQIEPYKFNPRKGLNPRYAELKASIQASGITNKLTVTRRSTDGKYTPFGGGNTRLMIAKELHADGDQRFAQLNVIIKRWQGDAQVITAHLVENELRADITFWEKASGVQQFRKELEAEQGKPLTAGDLNRELKSRGLSYGIKTLQNFAFAVENLEPVGPWLMSTSVNEVLRPQVGALLDLGLRLGMSAPLQAAITATMTAHADALRRRINQNDEREANEQLPVELDAAALLEDLEAAAAEQLKVSREQLANMLATMASNPNASAETLRHAPLVRAVPSVTVDPFPSAVTHAPIPQATQAPAPRANQVNRQVPLGGMLASVPPVQTPPVPPMPEVHAPTEAQPGSIDDDAFASIRDHLNGLHAAVPLSDVLMTAPLLPFGFMVDLPSHHLSHAGEAPLRPDFVPLRQALWKVLAALSYQYDRRMIESIPREDWDAFVWGQAYGQGRQVFEQTYAARTGFALQADQFPLRANELSLLLGTPDVAFHLIKLLSAMEQMRLNFPERFPPADDFVPLFEA